VPLDTRLQRLTQNLSPLQRAILMLRALKEDREPDPELHRIADEHERRAFNRYLSLLWITNHYLGAISGITSYRVELVEQAQHYADLFSGAADLLDEAEGGKRSRAYRNWRMRPTVTASELLRSLALECREDARQQLAHLWQEVGAQELVRSDIAAEFEGEDPLAPELRERDTETRTRLLAVADSLKARQLLTDPADEFVGAYQNAINEAFRQLHLTEPYQ
jgi:hypothetical protein